jgi:anti-sigma regulatory factor (Ser/Thr protein kinase)/RimJ/RimL family protein N-acetyltransferase
MEAHLYLEARLGMIGSATDFAYKWCVNMGLDSENAARMALAVDEILTAIILHAYKKKSGYVEIWFQYSLSEIEIIIQETGEPFDPERHVYSAEKAVNEGDFEGTAIAVAKKMTDHFLFLNRGKDGKEFRLVKQLSTYHIKDQLQKVTDEEEELADPDEQYRLAPVTSEDAEDIAKLIYRSYDYSYSKEDLYFPKRIEMALRLEYKFGVIARTSYGSPAGYFAVVRNTDSLIGEIGEAVVSPGHRKRGLMTRMLKKLIDMSRQRGLLGLYGMALTVHLISQKVNEKFDFRSTALIMAASPKTFYKGLDEKYPQAVSVLLEFYPLSKRWVNPVYLPKAYESIMYQIYGQFEIHPDFMELPETIQKEAGTTDLNLNINYETNVVLIIVRRFGKTFEQSTQRMLKSIEEVNPRAVYIDLPMDHSWIDQAVNWLQQQGFIFAGLMPFFHKEKDHLRMQKIDTKLDFSHIQTHSDIAGRLKKVIQKEYHESRKDSK